MFDLQAYKEKLASEISPSGSFNPIRIPINNKWLLVSSLQKSIRRGDIATAINSAYSLFSFDPNYLFWRLRIIASEDISLGDPEVANKIILFTSYQKEFDFKDKLETLLGLVAEGCSATKDKASHYVGWWLRDNPANYFNLLDLTPSQLVDRYHSDGLTIYDKAAVTWVLVGSKYVPFGDFEIPESHDALVDIFPLVSDSCQALFYMSMEKQKEAHFIAAPSVSLFYKKVKPSLIKRSPPNPTDSLGISLAAIDGHTSEGRRNISRYIESNNKLYEKISSVSSNPDVQLKYFSSQLFLKSGNLVNGHLWSKAHDHLYKNIINLKNSSINIDRYIDQYISQYMSGPECKSISI